MDARFACLLAIMSVGTVISHAQIKMDLRDVSDDGTPVRISGTVLLEENPSEAIRYTYRIKGSVTNLSDKAILITAIHFDTVGLNAPNLNYEFETDRFFSPEVLEPGHAEEINPHPVPFEAPSVNGAAVPDDADSDIAPTATAEVIFVQFIDGTVWGDLDAGGRFLVSRNRNLGELAKLDRIFNEHGQEAFKDELLRSDSTIEFTIVGALLYKCRSASDSCLISGLQSMVQAVAEHVNEIKKDRHWSVSGLVPE